MTGWMTKYGPRRVRVDLPTVEEALVAARCLSDEVEDQIALAASLMGVEVDAIRDEAKQILNAAAKARPTIQIQPRGPGAGAAPRQVVVEYKTARRTLKR